MKECWKNVFCKQSRLNKNKNDLSMNKWHFLSNAQAIWPSNCDANFRSLAAAKYWKFVSLINQKNNVLKEYFKSCFFKSKGIRRSNTHWWGQNRSNITDLGNLRWAGSWYFATAGDSKSMRRRRLGTWLGIKRKDLHYDPLMMSQKEALRKHPCIFGLNSRPL